RGKRRQPTSRPCRYFTQPTSCGSTRENPLVRGQFARPSWTAVILGPLYSGKVPNSCSASFSAAFPTFHAFWRSEIVPASLSFLSSSGLPRPEKLLSDSL